MPGVLGRVAAGLLRSQRWLIRGLSRVPPIRRALSGIVINVTSSACPPRPHALSLWTPPGGAASDPPAWAARGFVRFGTPEAPDPTTDAKIAACAAEVRSQTMPAWFSLTDRRFTGRHLPPSGDRPLPPLREVVALFMRPAGERMRLSPCNSLLLCFFAQWFTDSFLRTEHTDLRRNTASQEIDFCQIYGLDEATARALREGRGGRLRSRQTATGEYPALLFSPDGQVHPDFAGLDYARPGPNGTPAIIESVIAMGLGGVDPAERAERRAGIYATGLERGSTNAGYAAVSTLFLREHNRLASAIERANPGWSDDRIFEAARNTIIAIGLKLVVEEYIVQLAQTPIPLLLDPTLAPKRAWYRTNRIALEFNLLYRWHSMVPDAVGLPGGEAPFGALSFNNALLERTGLEALFTALSTQPAGEIGMRNVPRFLWDAEMAAHAHSRRFALAPMNDHRAHFGLDKLNSFDTLGPDSETRDALRQLYRNNIDAVEFLPGLFAEGDREDASFGSLLLRMVGYDAFTQALTNPLLAPQVFKEGTFSKVGWAAIHETRTLDDIFRRNTDARPHHRATLDHRAPPPALAVGARSSHVSTGGPARDAADLPGATRG
jgi:prostaglandin-endoperoxide synthase 2